VKVRLLRRAPAAFAGNDLVAAVERPNDDRLDQPARADRRGELAQRILVEVPPRLAGMGFDAADRQHLDAAASLSRDRSFLRHFAEKRGKAPPQSRRPAAERLIAAHAASAGCGRRLISSLASET